jgi:hypothetical protein
VRRVGTLLERSLVLVAGILLFLTTPTAFLPAAEGVEPPQIGPAVVRAPASVSLQRLLAGAAEYCDRLSRAALDFVCRERVSEWSYPDAAVMKYRMVDTIRRGLKESKAYLYDYQLVRDRAGSIRESRTLLREGRTDVHVTDAALQTRFFWHARIVMGPLGLLSRERQAEHDFRILRQERINGEPVAVIEAVPKPGVAADHLFGVVWLGLEDASILKIEWNPASIDNYAGVRERAERFRMAPRIVLTSEYGVEKNGIRFPSRYTVQEAYGRGSRRFQRSETTVVYDRYKFFTVETEVIY